MLGHRKKNVQLDYFALLPLEVLLFILSFLNPNDLFILCQVSNGFSIISSSNVLWKVFLKTSDIKDASAKALFRTQPDLIRHEYIQFASLEYRQKKAMHNLMLFKKIEEQYNHPRWTKPFLSSELEKTLELPKKNLKNRFLQVFKSTPTFGEKINEINALPLELLGKLFKKVNGWVSSSSNSMTKLSLQDFNRTLSSLVANFGSQTAFLDSQCLNKILDFSSTLSPHISEPDFYKFETLINIIQDKKMVTNPLFPRLIDLIIDRINNIKLITGEYFITSDNIHDIIISDVLANANRSARSKMTSSNLGC